MTSQRHTHDALLDATRECVLEVGVRRTTLTDVAKRANVSRMTLYRRYPDVDHLVRALMTREFAALLEEADRSSGQGNAREQLVSGAKDAIRLLSNNPIMQRVLQLDADLMLPYLTDRLGSTQRLVEQFLIGQIEAGHVDGSIRFGDAKTQARVVLLTTQSMVLSAKPATSGLDFAALLDELGKQLDGALKP
ncbi:TetR/AcrR family transcriptional regulator [Lentzea kentuckyensis]|jgi:AcrR family transcriptional regulator|uniref:TetR/AcrR family transcriptional regulator n=1 Tax=Lentzea kentuckyensis TaxID=360086 RepID=UPI000A37DF2A|nr:TetR/AcrR family transcriptional regulator [Lentzea kentuckyensis]